MGVVSGECGCVRIGSMGVISQMVPLYFFEAQTTPHGLCVATRYISTHLRQVSEVGVRAAWKEGGCWSRIVAMMM